MGAQPSRPSDAQAEELDAKLEALLDAAAASIAHADVLLVCTGAGWCVRPPIPRVPEPLRHEAGRLMLTRRVCRLMLTYSVRRAAQVG